MKKIFFLIITPLLLASQWSSASVSASQTELTSCPAVTDISRVLHEYVAGNGRWKGAAQGGENKGDIVKFMEAFYYPHKYTGYDNDNESENNKERKIGKLIKCTYRLNSGIVEMKLRDNKTMVNDGLYISLLNNLAWNKSSETNPYVSYICSADIAADCSFHRLSEAEIAAIDPSIRVILPSVQPIQN